MVKTWQVILATIGIFLAGLVTGGATAFGIVRWVAHHRGANAAPFVQGFGRQGQPQQFGPQLMRRYADELNLTEDQKARIMPIVKRVAAQLGRDRHEVQLKTAFEIEKMQDEIADILTPEQRSKFEELVAQQKARFQQFRQGAPQPFVPGARPGASEPAK
jgi:Spy/CpxP family protein refolding chaperone